MPPKGMRLSRSRQTAPQSPAKSSTTRTSPRQTRTGTRSQSRDLTGSPDQRKSRSKPLPPVDEEDDSGSGIVVVDIAQLEASSEVASSRASQHDPAESDASIDDTSSNGTTQLEALDTDLIADSLVALYEDASKILSLFDTDNMLDTVRDINVPSTKLAKRLRNFSSRFNTSRESYGNGSYINIPLILRKIIGGPGIVDGQWRPDPVLQLANLSILITNISQNDSTVLHDTLDRMFNTFPEPFLEANLEDPDASDWFDQFREKTLSFDIALRTQFFLSTVEKSKDSPSFDPDDILKQVFFDEDENLYGLQQRAEPTSSEIEAANADEQVILKHLNDIRNLFRKSGKNPIDLVRLRKRYPWQRFLPTAFEWIFARKRWLVSRIESQGGVEAIQERIEKRVFTPSQQHSVQADEPKSEASNKSIDSAPERTLEPQPTPSQTERKIMAKRIADLKRLRTNSAEQDESSEDEADHEKSQHSPLPHRSPLKDSGNRQQSAVTEIPQSPEAAAVDNEGIDVGTAADGDIEANVEDVEAEADTGVDAEAQPSATFKSWPVRKTSPPRATQSSIVPTQQTRAILEIARQQEALGNKENIDTTRRGFNTKQPSAKRLEWNDSQTGQKRSRSQVDDDENDTDEFETDERSPKRTRLPRQQPASAVDGWINEEGEDPAVQDVASEQTQDDDGHSVQNRPPPSAQPRSQNSPLRTRNHENSSRPPPSSAPPRHNTVHQSQNSPQRGSRDRSLPPATQHEQINRQAKAMMRMRPLLNPGSNDRAPQLRRAWEPEEINRLCEMVAQYGCAWSQILVEDSEHPDGPCLQRRTQVQLKDKARNLKMDYLKAGETLPPGFQAVTIKRADKEMLDSLGLPWV